MSGVIAVLVVVGVLAAMIGDRLGHRLGKKRVSLFTLRPRHSGLLATCVAGGFLALVLSPLALWSAGLFAPAPEPLILRFPVAVRPRTAADQRPTPRPPLRPEAGTPRSGDRHPVAVAASPDPRLPRLQRQLAAAQAEIASLRQAALPAAGSSAVVARRGELLCAANVPGNLDPAHAQAVLRDLLAAVETTTRQRGAAAGLTVATRQVSDAVSRLQGVGAFTLRLHAGRTSHAGAPVAVQLSVQPLPPGSLADLQEQDRLNQAGTTAAQGLEQALAQLPAGETVTSLPDGAYVPWQSALRPADGTLHLSWHHDPLAGGPLWLRLSAGADRP